MRIWQLCFLGRVMWGGRGGEVIFIILFDNNVVFLPFQEWGFIRGR